MTDSIRDIKKKAINDYISRIDDFSSIDIDTIKEDLSRLIGERPAIRLNYKQDQLINEDGSKGKRIEKLESLTIIFTYDILMGDKSIPMASTENFVIG